MPYNYDALRGKIIEHYGTCEAFAEALGLSNVTLSYKLSHKSEWKQGEMNRACSLLNIPIAAINEYFFKPKV